MAESNLFGENESLQFEAVTESRRGRFGGTPVVTDSNQNLSTIRENLQYVSVDELIDQVGGCGIYQKFICLLFSLANIPGTYQILLMYFTGHSPPWKCKNATDPFTSCKLKGVFTPADEQFHARCSMPRDHWVYVAPIGYSIVTEYDLVCEKNVFAALANSALYIGWGISCIPLGIAADRYGRKRVMYLSGALILISVLASAFVTSIWQFTILRALTGIGITGYGLTAYVLASEIVGTKFRSSVGCVLFLFGTVGLLLLTLQAYYIQNWRRLTIVCSAPYFAFAITILCIPESPQWLSSQGKTSMAMETLSKMAKINRKPQPKNQLEQSNKVRESQGSFVNLFKPRRRLRTTITLSFGWMVAGLTYYGISLASSDLSGNMYRDFALTSLVEIPSTLLGVPFLERLGRRRTTVWSMILSGLSCCFVAFLPEKSAIPRKASMEQMSLFCLLVYPILRVTGGMFGKFFISLAFNSLYVWSVELHPTTIRTQGMSFASLLARVGSSTAPFITDVLKEFHPALPFLVMGTMALTSGFASFLLPETRGQSTMNSVNEYMEDNRRLTRDAIQMNDVTERVEENFDSEDDFDFARDNDVLIRKPKDGKKFGL
eukprot:gene6992-7777_t